MSSKTINVPHPKMEVTGIEINETGLIGQAMTECIQGH